MNKKLILGLCAASLFGVLNTKGQATLNSAVSINWPWGTNAVTTTASGNTGVGAFGTNVFNGGALISSISIGNQSANPVDVAFFDAPLNPFRALYTNDVYTTTNTTLTGTVFYIHPANGSGYGAAQWTQALVNVTKIVTNFSGVKTTNTFTNALASGWWTNNQPTNMFRRVYFVTVPANSTVTPSLGAGLFVGQGLTITNTLPLPIGGATNLTISVTYDPSL